MKPASQLASGGKGRDRARVVTSLGEGELEEVPADVHALGANIFPNKIRIWVTPYHAMERLEFNTYKMVIFSTMLCLLILEMYPFLDGQTFLSILPDLFFILKNLYFS